MSKSHPARNNQPREIMNTRQAAQYLGVESEALYRYARTGKVPAFRLGGLWKFKRSLLDTWIEAQCRKKKRK